MGRGRSKPGPGRPTKFNRELANEILKAIRLGQPQDTAAQRAGIDPRSLRNWKKKGRNNPKTPLGQFCREIRRAAAQAEAHLGAKTYEKALEDGRLGLSYLAVRWPKRWSTTQQVELGGRRDGTSAPLVVEVRTLPPLPEGSES